MSEKKTFSNRYFRTDINSNCIVIAAINHDCFIVWFGTTNKCRGTTGRAFNNK